MAKFRKNKFFRKRQSQNETNQPEKFETKKPEITQTKNNTIYKTSSNSSWLKTGTKYAYIIAAAALLAGIFTPFTIGTEGEGVVYGMFSLFIGVAGGVLIFQAVKTENSKTMLAGIGLGLITLSLALVMILAAEIK